jgi:hypothetical protein
MTRVTSNKKKKLDSTSDNGKAQLSKCQWRQQRPCLIKMIFHAITNIAHDARASIQSKLSSILNYLSLIIDLATWNNAFWLRTWEILWSCQIEAPTHSLDRHGKAEHVAAFCWIALSMDKENWVIWVLCFTDKLSQACKKTARKSEGEGNKTLPKDCACSISFSNLWPFVCCAANYR